MRLSVLAIIVSYLLLIALFGSSCRQRAKPPINPINPATITGLVVYDVDPLTHSSIDNLTDVPSVTITQATTKAMFMETTYSDSGILWKGSFLGIATLNDGTQVRIAISYYGGYFKVLGKDGIYQACGKSRNIYDNVRRGVLKTFIPLRKEKEEIQELELRN